jgi:hypothetical protein
MRMIETSVPKSQHQNWDTPPEVKGNALILGDLHIPYHDADFIGRCMGLARKWEINHLILGGDALDARAFSHWGEDFEQEKRLIISNDGRSELEAIAEEMPSEYREKIFEFLADVETQTGNIGEELKEARKVLKAIDVHFENVLWMMGNHETWVLKTLQKALPAADLGRLMELKWEISPYYWCRLESGGIQYQIEHPKNAGKGSSKKLASKFTTNIIMFHNHHLSYQSDPSGQYLAIETGMCADRAKIQYDNQRHASNDEHITGAVLVRNGKAWLLNQFTDWEYLLR